SSRCIRQCQARRQLGRKVRRISFSFPSFSYSNSRHDSRARVDWCIGQIKTAEGESVLLHNTLVEHSIRDLDEASYVCADHEIARLAVLFRSVPRVFKDCRHDVAQTGIDLLAGPWQTHRVLAHFQTGRRHASGIRRFAGTKQNLFLNEKINCRWYAGHVGRFRHKITTVVDQSLRVFSRDLVLRRTRKSAIALYAPGAVAGYIFGTAELFGVLADASAPHVLDAHDEGQFFLCDAVFVVNAPA